ncbi:MAG: Gfo/Idh/MocA family protein [Chloroflexota bacterium]
MPLRVGVIGAGDMGRTHALAYRGIPGVQVVTVCDLDGEAAQRVATQVDAEWTHDYAAVLARSDVDAVSICLPDHLHRDATVVAAGAGKHILLEKPLATSIADGLAIVEATAAAGVTFMVGHTLRFDPRYYLAQQAIEAGQVGTIQTMYARRMGRRSRHLRAAQRTNLPFFLGIHDFDVLRWFAGGEVERVMAHGQRGYFAAQGFDADDAMSAVLEFANGAVATVDLAWNLPEHITGFHFRADVIGDKGSINISHADHGLTISTDERLATPDTAFGPVLYGAVAGIMRTELEHFVQCVLTGARPAISPTDALEAVRIAVAVDIAARSGDAVRLGTLRSDK